VAKDPIADQVINDRKLAERVARSLGCQGAHKKGDGWAPCESNEALMTLIRKGAAGYREWKKRNSGEKSGRATKAIRVIVQPELEDRKKRRCRRRHCRRYRNHHWEHLGERGVQAIDTLPGGGLVSG
jgi:hypothetical protein